MQSDVIEEDFTIAVSFRHSAKPEDYRCNHLNLSVGDLCVVDSERGPAIGSVARAKMKFRGKSCCHKKAGRLRNVIRKATSYDEESYNRIGEKEREINSIASRKVSDSELKMKISYVEVTYDEKRAIISYTSDGRIDFRSMVKSLSKELDVRVEMRQVGSRDEAKMMGGAGVCGQKLCCSSFLTDFSPVSIRMAKDQGLSLNPSKISGACGRLMCCLNYENSFYKEMQKVVPRVGKTVDTPDGRGKVIVADYLRSKVTVYLGDDKRETFEASSVSTIKHEQQQRKPGKKGKGGKQKSSERGAGKGARPSRDGRASSKSGRPPAVDANSSSGRGDTPSPASKPKPEGERPAPSD